MDDNLSIYLSSGKLGQLFAHFYMKWIYFGFFDHHVTVSNYTVDELLLAGRGHIRERGIWVRGMGVDLDTFSPSHRSPELRAALLRRAHAVEGTRLLLYVGRLAPEKNLGLLVDAFARLPQSDRLLIAGDGIERASLEQKCRKCFGDRVQFLGHQPDRLALAQLYANCDLFVHPNPKEPFGIAPLEAMASGLPMVVPNTGGVLTYANSSNAWLAAPNPAAFSAAIEQALIAPEREEKRARAFADAQQYHWHAVARRYLDLYRDIAAGASPHDAEFRSTPGNWLGQEFAALAPSARLTAQTPPPSPPKA
jgi:glycosyltransferase involved in cell wall biosynthesis